MLASIRKNLAGSIAAKQAFAETSLDRLVELADWTATAMRDGGKLLLCGNGGSAADAQHVAAEFVNRFLLDRAPLPAIALTTDSSVLTSIGNDFSFDQIFVKQVQALARPGDLLIGISTSGTSPNVVGAVRVAREMGVRTAALIGGTRKREGGLNGLADLVLTVPSDHTPHIQECHLWIEHMLCELVEKALFPTA